MWRAHQSLRREAELMRLDVLRAMNAARRERRGGVIVTRLSDGEQRFVEAGAVEADPLSAELEAALRMGKSGAAACEEQDYFLTGQAPPPRPTLVAPVQA